MFHPAVSGYNRGRTHFHPGLYRLVPGVLCPGKNLQPYPGCRGHPNRGSAPVRDV